MPNINIFNCDCLHWMATKPDKYYDLAIVDPPYGINATNMQMGTNMSRKNGGYPGESTATKQKKGRLNQGSGKLKDRILNTSNCDWDKEIPSAEYFTELFLISKNQIIWGGNYFPLPPTRCIICWDKKQPWDNFSQWEMAWTSFDMPAPIVRISSRGGANNIEKIHPTEKPVKLYEWIIRKFATPGMKLLDTHGGSMNSVKAAYNLGFDITCLEKDTTIFNTAQKSIQEHTKQLIFSF